MSLRQISLLLAIVTGAVALHAEDAKTDPPYELRNKSVFPAPAEAQRAPFWPIGWTKRKGAIAAAPQVQAPKITIDEKSFHLTSILLGSGTTPSLAVINQRAYSEGEFLRMPKTLGAVPARIRVQRINDGSVILQNGDQTMVVPLQRPELTTRTEEKYLDPDR